jgi:hypothetical protein
LSILPS